jgi:hypothetical protein
MQQWMDLVVEKAEARGVDPAVVLAIIEVESAGRNVIGDGGHGRGLMQIDDRSHAAWLADHADGLDPESNIDYGCLILRNNINFFGSDLRPAIAAYNCGAGNALAGIRESGNPDKYTTGHNYSARVLALRPDYQTALEENMAVIPQEYVDKFSLNSPHDIGGLIANFEGVVNTAHDEGYQKGLADCRGQLAAAAGSAAGAGVSN